MSRPKGTPLTFTVLKIHIPEDLVIPLKKKRYVYMQHIHKRVNDLAEETQDIALKDRYFACIRRNGYALKEVYGFVAIDIDEPMIDGVNVSVELKFTVGEGKDEATRKR